MFFQSASVCASSVMNLSASLPVPPYGVNARGLKEPCSISITRWLYIRFFSFSLLLKAVSGSGGFWRMGWTLLHQRMPSAPFARNRERWNPIELHRTSWHCCLELLLSTSQGAARPQHHDIHPWEGLQIGLAHHHASRGWIRLSCTTLHGQHQNACHMDTSMEGTLVSTRI